jgi:hypothetical protein
MDFGLCKNTRMKGVVCVVRGYWLIGMSIGFAEFEVDGTAAALREYGVGIAYPSSSVPWAPS